jgi:hypothetical protein
LILDAFISGEYEVGSGKFFAFFSIYLFISLKSFGNEYYALFFVPVPPNVTV